jgi:hypothetical protein
MRGEKDGHPPRTGVADSIASDVHLPAFGLAANDISQEGHKLFAGAARRSFAQHLVGSSTNATNSSRPISICTLDESAQPMSVAFETLFLRQENALTDGAIREQLFP